MQITTRCHLRNPVMPGLAKGFGHKRMGLSESELGNRSLGAPTLIVIQRAAAHSGKEEWED